MSAVSPHGEWLSLIDISGPFLAEPVLKDTFPQGLEEIDASKRKLLRQAYDEWREAQELDDPELDAIHAAWVDLVLRRGLELDEDGAGDVFKARRDLPATLKCDLPERRAVLYPDFAVVNDSQGLQALMLVATYGPNTPLDEPIKVDGWAASPAERMVELCRATGVRLGLVTNGERWMFVDAPVGAVTSFASWYANLWSQEPKTLQAFVNLLGVRRFFVDQCEQLPALLDESLKLQDEVTDALGEQVGRAVEVLVQSLDRANVDRDYKLLEGVEPAELYEAALTVMMRIVFLLSAEERGLLLMGDERYEANYAVSTLRMQLRGDAEEILERRWDAWSRLLAIFRAVYGGIEHEALRLPALGGSLFDPDRYPFLEGRLKDSHWKTDPAAPLPIDNRTVLLLLDAVQLFQGRTLSYRALDVEQIGYVYEGLLERTVVRAKEVTLDLDATKNAKKPWVTLDELEAAAAKSAEALEKLLKERTGSSKSRVTNDLKKKVEDADADKLLTACHGDQALRDRVKPYFHFLRIDRWDYPLVYPVGTFMVTTGTDRRETGTHYTPKSLTEAIVKETLEPVAYVGPAEGKPRDEWKLKSPAELLDLKICDPAMGSGAFLVQVCRWLSERLVEAWGQSEEAGNSVTAEGVVVAKRNGYEPLRNDPEERLLTARRLIAERCLYGVDVNPLAVELAKLSIWLVTLAKGRPFGFLDHNLRSGDSLLGIYNMEQLHYLDMNPGSGSSKKLFASNIDQAVQKAIDLRIELRSRAIRDIRDVEVMAQLDEQARQELHLMELIADSFVIEILTANNIGFDTTALSIEVGAAIEGKSDSQHALSRRTQKSQGTGLSTGRSSRRLFHWPLEFPEVFQKNGDGFDAIVGNPPFLGGTRISYRLGDEYLQNLYTLYPYFGNRADLVSIFLNRASELCHSSGYIGIIGTDTIAQGDTRKVGLERLLNKGLTVFRASTSVPWPGKAAQRISVVYLSVSPWQGSRILNNDNVANISSFLDESDLEQEVHSLKENLNQSFEGAKPSGEGFVLTPDQAAALVKVEPSASEVIYPYLRGEDLNSNPDQNPSFFVIDFGDRSLEDAASYPNCLNIIREKVKPVRDKVKRKAHRERWWMHGELRPGLYAATGNLSHVIVHAFTSKHIAFCIVPNTSRFAAPMNVFAFSDFPRFGILQSSIHTIWALKHCSTTMGGSIRYTRSDVFNTYPFPTEAAEGLSEIAQKYHSFRSELMLSRNEGLTKTYNRFNDTDDNSDGTQELRSIHVKLDDAVCASYGWRDLSLGHSFYETPRGIRFTLQEEARLELLRRLTKLNQRRYEAEQTPQENKASSSKPKKAIDTDNDQKDLFSEGQVSASTRRI